MTEALVKGGHTVPKHGFVPIQPNPIGTGHFYFTDTYIHSACWEPGKCSSLDPIVGRSVGSDIPGRMVDLDTDWEVTPEMIGYSLNIPGVLTARLLNGPISQMNKRVSHLGGDESTVGTIKTKMVEIKWHS
uniref:Uncharacterized protein n=1 Tax=Ciona savignyi TaxID=51511 RepID=H2Z903_CIOSA